MESSLDMQYRSIQKDRCLSTTLSLILGKHTTLSFSFTHTSIYPLYTTPPRLLGRFAALCSIQVLTFTFNCYIVCRHFSSYSVTNKQTNKHPAKQAKYVFRFFDTFLYLIPNPSRDIFYAPFYKISYSALPLLHSKHPTHLFHPSQILFLVFCLSVFNNCLLTPPFFPQSRPIYSTLFLLILIIILTPPPSFLPPTSISLFTA